MSNSDKLVKFSDVRDCLSTAMADYILHPETTISETSAVIAYTTFVIDKLRNLPDVRLDDYKDWDMVNK